jgi:hypothetical protein
MVDTQLGMSHMNHMTTSDVVLAREELKLTLGPLDLLASSAGQRPPGA